MLNLPENKIGSNEDRATDLKLSYSIEMNQQKHQSKST